MIYRHSDEDIDNYYERAALNQSSLKVIIEDGMQAFLMQQDKLIRQEELYYEEKEHFIVGSAVDYCITSGEEKFKQKYHFSTLTKKPKDKGLSIIHMVFDRVKEKNKGTSEGIWEFTNYLEDIYLACNDQSFYNNRRKVDWREDVRYKELIKANAEPYWQELIDAGDKIILTDSMYEVVKGISNSFLQHRHTSQLLNPSNQRIDTIYQMPLYFEVDGIPCKALPDIIRIDHSTRRISIIDIKTTRELVTKFNIVVKKRRYDLQGAFYLRAAKACLTQIATLIGQHLVDYTFANPAFIVESKLSWGTPLVFPMTNTLFDIGVAGDESSYGYTQGIAMFKEWSNKDFSLDKIVEGSNGVVFLDGNYEYTNYDL
jgi:hypothetical protein